MLHGNRRSPTAPAHHVPLSPYVGTVPLAAPDCTFKHTRERTILPPLVQSNDAPNSSLVSLLGLLRQPATAADYVNIRLLDRWPYQVLAVYMRYIRVLSGPDGARIAILPARICGSPGVAPPGTRTYLAPHDVLLMQVLSNPKTFRPTVYVGTAADISNRPADPSLVNAPPRHGQLQATVVPDGVARVVLRFTPPFRSHYAVTLQIHDNVGIASPLPGYPPTITTWYAASGKVIRTFTNRQMLRYDNCLARHAKNCS
jgi:hypothetical protein